MDESSLAPRSNTSSPPPPSLQPALMQRMISSSPFLPQQLHSDPPLPTTISYPPPPPLPTTISYPPPPPLPTTISYPPPPPLPTTISYPPPPPLPTTISYPPPSSLPTTISYPPPPPLPTTIPYHPPPPLPPTTISYPPLPPLPPTTISYPPLPSLDRDTIQRVISSAPHLFQQPYSSPPFPPSTISDHLSPLPPSSAPAAVPEVAPSYHQPLQQSLPRLTFPVCGGVLLDSFQLEHGRSVSQKLFHLKESFHRMVVHRIDLELLFTCYHHDDEEQLCNWPQDLSVSINHQNLPIERGDSENSHKPLHVKRYCQPGQNLLEITVTSNIYTHMFCLKLVHRPSVNSVLQGLLRKRLLPTEYCIAKCKKLLSTSDNSVQQSGVKVSLKCPITSKKIKLPARGANCKHTQCFDVEAYLLMNSEQSRWPWKCPVCRTSAQLEGLEVDQYIWSIITQVNTRCLDVDEIIINSSANWTFVDKPQKDDEPKVINPPKQQPFKTESMLLFEEAMKEGHIEVSIIKCLLLGTAGVGKTCLLHLLLDMLPPQLRQSTGCIEQAIRAICAKYGIDSVGKWQKVNSDGLHDLLAGSVLCHPKVADAPPTCEQEEANASPGPASYTMEEAVNELEESSASTKPVMKEAVSELEESSASTRPVMEETVSKLEESSASTKPVSYTMEAIVKLLEEKPHLGKLQDMTWVYLVDSGGQPQFHELLSAFVRNALVGILVHKLSERLDDYPHVRYFDKKGEQCGTGYRSLLTNRAIFQHCIQTVQSLHYSIEKSCCPNLAVVGTFRDEEHLCKGESRNEKNEQLCKILRPILGKVFFLTGMQEVIFPVNTISPDRADKDIAKKLRHKIESLKPPPEKLPLKWYGLELELEKIAFQTKRWVFTKDECLQVAKRLHFPSDKALDAALVHLDKLNIFLYYPSVLPELVFCSPTVLLDKISELVEESYSLKHGPDPYALVEGNLTDFCNKGLVTAQLLKNYPKHYTEFFTQAHLLKLFESLLIVAPVDHDTYFMPSVLDVLKQSDIRRPPRGCQLVISFMGGYAPLGLFSSLVAFLLSESNKTKPNSWLIVGDGSKLYRNHITFLLDKYPGSVVLVDSAAFFEVYLNLDCKDLPMLYKDTCRYVSCTIERSLNEAIKARNFQNVHYHKAISCPCDEGCHTLHPALPRTYSDIHRQVWQCTQKPHVCGELDEHHLVWVKNYIDTETEGHTVTKSTRKFSVAGEASSWKSQADTKSLTTDTSHRRKTLEGSSDPADTKTFTTAEGSSHHAVTKHRKTSAGEESRKDQADIKTSTTVTLHKRKFSEGSSDEGSSCHAVTKHRKTSVGNESCKDQTDAKTSTTVQQQTVTLPQLIRFRTTSGSIIDQIGTRYWDLGVLLLNDDTGAVTQAIIEQHHEDATKINREILKRWIQGQGMPVKWATLIEVLRDIGLTELTREIEKKITQVVN